MNRMWHIYEKLMAYNYKICSESR